MSLRKVGRHLGWHHRPTSLWVKAHAALLPEPSVPVRVDTAEMDEMSTFIGD